MTLITPEQRDFYHTEGYMILPGIIPPDMLTMLREECSYFLGYKDSQMDSKGMRQKFPKLIDVYCIIWIAFFIIYFSVLQFSKLTVQWQPVNLDPREAL